MSMSDAGDASLGVFTPSPSDNSSHLASPAPSPQSVQDSGADFSRRASRALVPQQPLPAGGFQPRGIPIVTASSSEQDGGPSPVGRGPGRKDWTVPSRPRPGRKPATDEPASKRKAQNRESQRAFRARKAAKVQELMAQVESVEQSHRCQTNDQLNEINRLGNRVRELEDLNKRFQKERDYWREQYNKLRDDTTPSMPTELGTPLLTNAPTYIYPNSRRDSTSAGYGTPSTSAGPCNRCRPDQCACFDEAFAESNTRDPPFMEAVALPPRGAAAAPAEPMEIDFTAKFASTQPVAPTAFMPEEEHQSCGFCTDASNCPCKDSTLQTPEEPVLTTERSATAMTGPGSCSDCQANPKQRAWCQRISQLRGEATPPQSRRNSAMSTSLETMEPKIESKIDILPQKSSAVPGTRSIGCSETFKLLDGRVPMDLDHMEWRQLKPVPPQPRPSESRRDTFMSMEPGTYSAMEVDVGSILTTLQHSRKPLEPRPSDGPNARLVRQAEKLRRSSNSPFFQASGQKELPEISSFDMRS